MLFFEVDLAGCAMVVPSPMGDQVVPVPAAGGPRAMAGDGVAETLDISQSTFEVYMEFL